MAHTPSTYDTNMAPNSTFHLVTREVIQEQPKFMFQKVPDPSPPFGLNRSPPHHFMLRLRNFLELEDVLVVVSTAATDIGLLTKSKVPLDENKSPDKITSVFTMTEMKDDSSRAQLPMTADLSDTSTIGFALDLSSKEKVGKPIAGDEMMESPTPLPAIMVLNNEGVLASWWFVYAESVRQGKMYPGLIAAGNQPQTMQQSPAPSALTSSAFGASKPAFGTSAQPAFGATAFGSPSPSSAFGKPAFGASAAPASIGAFGATSGLGKSQSPWGTPATTATTSAPTFGSSTPAFSTPAFGATSTPAFGGLGARPSPWASGGSTAPNAAFGQAGGLAMPTSFSTPAPNSGTLPQSSGFAAFASKGGFASAASPATTTGSVFGAKPTASSVFGAPSTGTGSVFGQPKTESSISGSGSGIFGQQKIESNNLAIGGGIFSQQKTESNTGLGGGVFGQPSKPNNTLGAGGFVLGSTFKADPDSKDANLVPSSEPNKSLFGNAFGTALGDASKSPTKPVSTETEMESNDVAKQPEEAKPSSTTPSSTPAAPKTSLFPSTASKTGGLFGTPAITSPWAPKTASPGFSFGDPPPNPFARPTDTLSTPLPSITQGSKQPSQTSASPKVKEEAVEEEPSMDNIPEAPLPPDPTSKTSYIAGDTSVSSNGTDTPSPDSLPKAAPEPKTSTPTEDSKETVKKSIPADLIPPSDVPGGPEDDGDESGFETEGDGEDGYEGEELEEGEFEEETRSEDGSEEEESEQGSGEDVTKDLSPDHTPGFTPQSSFGGRKIMSTETSSGFTKISDPAKPNLPRSLFGEVGQNAPILAPPSKLQASPRSPSPIRNALPGRMLRPDSSRSVSAPGFASQILGSQRPGTKTMAPPQKTTYELTLKESEAEEKRRIQSRARKEAEESQSLVDEDDDMMQNFLASDIEGTLTLDEFVAHADYVQHSSKDDIPGQVEAVYRDINSMIDTLGVNQRALKCFMKGHTEFFKEEGRTREDLEDADGWCLVEIENFSSIVEKDLARELEASRVKDVVAKVETCNDIQKDLVKLRAKHHDIKKIIDVHKDPNLQALARAQPLTAEQTAQQHDLRRDYTKFQKLLSEAEEGLTVLKAKIVSQSTSNGRANGSAGPTVEAVMRTITKMTSMAEKKSGDIDVLEGQMRRLRLGSVIGSREGSPFATPQNNRTSLRNPGTSSTYGLFYTPDSIKDTPQRFQNSLRSSIGSNSGRSPQHKKMSGYTAEEKTQLKSKLARKKEVTDRLRAALRKVGTNVRLMNDDE